MFLTTGSNPCRQADLSVQIHRLLGSLWQLATVTNRLKRLALKLQYSRHGACQSACAQLLADDQKNLFNEGWDSLSGLRRQSISKCWGFLNDGRLIDIVPNRQDYGFTIGDLASR
jgi:hypothetical protein